MMAGTNTQKINEYLKNGWIDEYGNKRKLYESNGFVYFVIDNESESDKNKYAEYYIEPVAVMVDYCGPDTEILVLPDIIDDYFVSEKYENKTMNTPKNLKYLVMMQPTILNSGSFENSKIKGIIALQSHDPDYPEEKLEWKHYTRTFVKERVVRVYYNLSPDDYENHYYELDNETLYEICKKFATFGTAKDMELLLEKNMTFAEIYFNAIVDDDVETIKKLERYGFPKYKEFVTFEDKFLKKIPEEVEHFHSLNIKEYFDGYANC